jgi:hypothetical protein
MREEGHYYIRRVPKLPKKGNANTLYAIIGSTINEFFRWVPNGSYEEIKIGGGEQDNFSRTISVNVSDLSGNGTIKEQIVEYVNTLNYDKIDTDSDIWVEYDDTPIITLTAFNVDTEGDVCNTGASEEFLTTYYHNGAGKYPALGDIVYSDMEGLIALNEGEGVMRNGKGFTTDEDGILVEFSCL